MERSNRMTSAAIQQAQLTQEIGNFDFKLYFHASRVPKSGWDKLVVSLVSIETGKIIIKSSRGLVKNGSCKWPDPIVESTRITQDPASRVYNKKLYKLVVQMGSLRVGILGEATINLTDYINSESPDTISLPLKKCTTGTVLQVKVQCLTPKSGSRELERQRNANLDDDDLNSASESDKDSYSSGDMTVGSLRSLASQTTNGQLYLPNTPRQFKANRGVFSPNTANTDGPLSMTTSRQDSFNSSLYGSTPQNGVQKDARNGDYPTSSTLFLRKSSSTASQDSRRSQESLRSSYASTNNDGASTTNGWQDMYAWQAECTNPILFFSPSSQNGSRVVSTLPQKLDAAEATIRELHEEALAWERHARKLIVEAETLRQQLASELKSGAELRIRISSLESENETLSSELEQRKTPENALNKRQDVDDYTRLELEKTKQLVTALQQEVTFEKEVSANLQLQLQKTRDSNNELVSLVTELEVALDVRNKEFNRLAEGQQQLSEELEEMQASNAELLHRVAESEATALACKREMEMEIKTDIKLDKSVQNEAKDEFYEVIEILKKEMEKNTDCKELTEENIELLHKLHKANIELDANVKLIEVLEASLEGLLKFEAPAKLLKQLSSNNLTDKRECIDNLKMQVGELEHQNGLLKVQLSKAKRDVDSQDTKLQDLMEQKGHDQLYIKELEFQVQLLSEEIKVLHAFKSEHRSSNSQLETEKSEMQEKLDEAHNQTRTATERLDELVEQMAALTTTLDLQLIANRTLERRGWELQSNKEELESQVDQFGNEDTELLERIVTIEGELKSVFEKRDLLKVDLETTRTESLQDRIEDRLCNENSQEMLGAHEQKLGEFQQAFSSQEVEEYVSLRQCLGGEFNQKKDEVSFAMLAYSAVIREFQQQLQEARTECVLLKKKCCYLEAEVAEKPRKGDSKEQSFQEEIVSLCIVKDGIEQRANKAEEGMLQLQRENTAAISLLQTDVQGLTEKLTSMSSENEKLEDALYGATELHTEKVELEDCFKNLQTTLKETEEQLTALLKKMRKDKDEEQEATKIFYTVSSQKLQESFLDGGSFEIRSIQSLLSQSPCRKHLPLSEQVLRRWSPMWVELNLELENMKRTVDILSHEYCSSSFYFKAAIAEWATLQQGKMDAVEKLSLMSVEESEAGKIQEGENGNELLHLKGHVSQVQRQLVDQEEENLEFQKQVESLEENLLHKSKALFRIEEQLRTSGCGADKMNSDSFSLSDSKEVLELRQKLKLLEEYMDSKEEELHNFKTEFMERETDLCDRIEQLELSNEQLAIGQTDPGADQLKKELLRLQIQNSSLSRKEQELLSSMQMQEVLQKEIERLQEANEFLETRLEKFMETAKNPFLLEKIVNLETELSEALEANSMYRLQLQSVLDKQQLVNMVALGDLDNLERIRSDLLHFKKKAAELEDQLNDMKERYTRVSLQLAETEKERGELLITLRNLRNMKLT